MARATVDAAAAVPPTAPSARYLDRSGINHVSNSTVAISGVHEARETGAFDADAPLPTEPASGYTRCAELSEPPSCTVAGVARA